MSQENDLTGMISPRGVYGYIPGLDGIRAIAVLIVLAAHFGLSNLIPGGFGVTLFFFISGFLITRLLLAETDVKGRVSLRQFYTRRVIRLYPALLFMLLVSTLVFWISGFKGPSGTEVSMSVFYLANLYQLLGDIGITTPTMSWRPLWSLAVEEHFYLVFPLLLVLIGAKTQMFLRLLVAVLILMPLWRLVISFTTSPEFSSSYTYMMSDTRMDSIVWGCLLSVLLHRPKFDVMLGRLIGWLPFLSGLAVLFFCFVFRDDLFRNTIRYSLQGAAIFVLILNFYFNPKLLFAVKLCEFRPLAYLGVLSYGLYLWHFPIIDWLTQMSGSHMIAVLCGFPLTILIAHMSYRYVETPFIRLRKRFGAHIIQRVGDKKEVHAKA